MDLIPPSLLLLFSHHLIPAFRRLFRLPSYNLSKGVALPKAHSFPFDTHSVSIQIWTTPSVTKQNRLEKKLLQPDPLPHPHREKNLIPNYSFCPYSYLPPTPLPYLCPLMQTKQQDSHRTYSREIFTWKEQNNQELNSFWNSEMLWLDSLLPQIAQRGVVSLSGDISEHSEHNWAVCSGMTLLEQRVGTNDSFCDTMEPAEAGNRAGVEQKILCGKEMLTCSRI